MLTPLELKSKFERYIESVPYQSEPQNLYDPVHYILSLPAKRIRPVLLLLAHQMYQESIDKAFSAAYAVELFHNFTLLHDDIMDEAPTRRGHPTVHEKYDTNTAILSGDVMQIYVYKHLLSTDSKQILKVLEIFTETSIKICEGQQWDMDFETRDDVTIEEYLKMIEYKTAVLLGAALQIGALLGGASEEEANHLYNFGTQLGISFQIQDDILDTYADPETFGKQVGGDIIQGKKTYLYLKTIELLEGEELESFKEVYHRPSTTNKVEIVKKYFNSAVISEYANQLRDAYKDLAFGHLDMVTQGDTGQLSIFTKAIMDRQK